MTSDLELDRESDQRSQVPSDIRKVRTSSSNAWSSFSIPCMPINVATLLVAAVILSQNPLLCHLDAVIIQSPRITRWSISHFLLYLVIGLLCPGHRVFYFWTGVSWELFERLYGIHTNQELYWTSNGVSGQVTDIVMNVLGYELGQSIAIHFNKCSVCAL